MGGPSSPDIAAAPPPAELAPVKAVKQSNRRLYAPVALNSVESVFVADIPALYCPLAPKAHFYSRVASDYSVSLLFKISLNFPVNHRTPIKI